MLSSARAGCPCSSRVMAIVWNYFSCHCYLAGSRPAIICMGSSVVVPMLGSLRLGDGELFMPRRFTDSDNGRARAYCACSW